MEVTVDMNPKEEPKQESATETVVNVKTPDNLTAPAATEKKEADSDEYTYSDEEEKEEHNGIIPTTEFNMKELAKTEHLTEAMLGKKSPP